MNLKNLICESYYFFFYQENWSSENLNIIRAKFELNLNFPKFVLVFNNGSK
jgi:hypothetical protein